MFWGIPIRIADVLANPTDTDSSTEQTIRQMTGMVRSAYSNPVITDVVNSCLKTLPTHSTKRDLVRSIYRWVKGNVVFEEDEKVLAEQLGYVDTFKELLISPIVIVQMPQPMGDCDDFSMLLASLLMCAHIRCWFVTIAIEADNPNKWSHVYCAAELVDEGCVIPLDASHGTYPGWEYTGNVYRRRLWFVG
jgi:transglutaminase-like putative cysteine protease